MAPDIIRDSPFGQIVHWLSNGRIFPYCEEKNHFACPSCYKGSESTSYATSTAPVTEKPASTNDADDKSEEAVLSSDESVTTPGAFSEKDNDDIINTQALNAKDEISRVETAYEDIRLPGDERAPIAQDQLALTKSKTAADVEAAVQAALSAKKTTSRKIVPDKLENGTTLVTWYTEDDPDNPQNWSSGKKAIVTTLIMFYTTAVYLGGSIFAPAEGAVSVALGVSDTVSALGLALYVLGYGLGPLLWAPLSEIPSIGRNPIYMVTFVIYVILAVPASLVNNLAGLLVLRFLMGFFGSPALATGGATLGDMYSLLYVPFVLSLWALAACVGPAVGPMISGFSVSAETWHWACWEILWLAGPVCLAMFFFLPETNPGCILLSRARHLRKKSGNKRLLAQSEIDLSNMTAGSLAKEALLTPFKLNFLDPAIAFTSVYTAMMYALFYSFFEAFPLVYIDIYHFNLGLMGVAFISAAVGFWFATAAYWAYLYWYVVPRVRKYGLGAQEERLVPALICSTFMPIGMFMYGWTAREGIPWIVPSIGIAITTFGVFIVFQCIFIYLPLTYPIYAASLFAGNDFARSCLAAGAILYSTPLFKNLGIGKGSSLLASLMAGCVFGMWALWYYGAKLRARSKFAVK